MNVILNHKIVFKLHLLLLLQHQPRGVQETNFCSAPLFKASNLFLSWQMLAINGSKVKFSLEQATKAQRGSRGIALPFL
jgi:hypothetical protein